MKRIYTIDLNEMNKHANGDMNFFIFNLLFAVALIFVYVLLDIGIAAIGAIVFIGMANISFTDMRYWDMGYKHNKEY